MKEITSVVSMEFDIVNRVTGEILPMSGTSRNNDRYLNISKITTRINQMDYTTVLSTIATSLNQLPVIAKLLDMVDADNKLLILNQVELSKKFGCSRKILNTILSNLGKSELAIKENKNIYHINPYIFIGKRTRCNSDRERLQAEWQEKLIEFKVES